MTNTVRCIPEDEGFDREAVVASVRAMEREVQAYVPGYRLKADPVFERLPTPWGAHRGLHAPGGGGGGGLFAQIRRQPGHHDGFCPEGGEVFAQHLLGKPVEEVVA